VFTQKRIFAVDDVAKLFERAADARRAAQLLRQDSRDLGLVGFRRRLAKVPGRVFPAEPVDSLPRTGDGGAKA
jgi:hypothetical protein